MYDPTVYVTDPYGVAGRGDSLPDALADYLDTLDFQRSALRQHELTPGAKRLRDAIERMMVEAGAA